MNVLKTNIQGSCPGGFCDYIQQYSEVLVVILCLDGFIFFVTLLPPLFSWSNRKADGRKRIFFAALACFTFYFWLAFMAVNSLYCFGFLAHQGPCRTITTATETITTNATMGTTGSMATASMASNTNVMMTSDTKETTLLQPTTMAATMLTLPENNIERPVASTKSSSRLPAGASTASTSSMMPSSLASVASSVVLSSLSPSTLSSSGMTSVSNGLSSPASSAAAAANAEATAALASTRSAGVPMALISWTSDKANSSCVQLANEHETQLRNLTLVNALILIVLLIVFIANAREAMTAKALFHKETLCKREEVQRFLSSLVLKPPEVGHLINCFHMAKTNSDTRNKKANVAAASTNLSKKGAKDGGPPRKVVTFSAIENFAYQTWRDFSDVRLIEPSGTYPIIEIEVILNFFPGDHFTAEKYKAFVNQMTKTYSGKDGRITIDDYFHVEDHREWTFFIGNEGYITPWWDKDAAKIPLSCFFLFGWPFRLAYGGRIAKHQVEIKKAVFVENNSADEGVSLSATPASDENAADKAESKKARNDFALVAKAASAFAKVGKIKKKPIEEDVALGDEEDGEEDNERKAMLEATIEKQPHITSTASSSNHDQFTEHRVNAVVSQPPREIPSFPPQPQQQITHPLQQVPPPQSAPVTQPQLSEQQQHQYFYQQMQVGPSIPTTRKPQIPAFGHPLANVLPPQPSQPLLQQHQQLQQQQQQQHQGARTKDTTVTTVTHQDINGVNTVALKDMDHAQMQQMSGYETYV